MKLASHLKERGISQADFARLIDVTPGAVTRWLNGSRVPSISQMAAIRKATNDAVGPSDFVDLTCKPLDWRCALRAWAIENGVELREVARRIGIANTTLSTMLTGAIRPSMKTARRIVAVVGNTIRLEAFLDQRSNHANHNQSRAKAGGKGSPALHPKRARLHAR